MNIGDLLMIDCLEYLEIIRSDNLMLFCRLWEGLFC